MAPRLPVRPDRTPPRPPGLANRHHPHGQAQADLGSVDGLRGLRRGHRVHRRLRDGAEDAAEAVLQADHEAWSVEVVEHGGDDEEVGRRGDFEEGGQWDAAEE